MESNRLSERESRRYKEQIDLAGIGSEGQKKIKNTRILVVGAGGKGTSALKNLIGSGVGFLGISDNSIIQEDTLSRQSLYNDSDIGKQKAIVAKQYLQARNRLSQIKVHNIHLIADNITEVINEYDLLIDATNSYESHIAISTAAKIAGKSIIIGHIANNIIYITSLSPDSEKTINEILIPDSIEKDEKDLQSPLVLVNSFAGIILANEALKIVLQKPSQLFHKLLIIKLSDYSFSFQPY